MNIQNPILLVEGMASAAQVSLIELLGEADVAYTTYTRWKNGSMSPTFKTITRLEKARDRILKRKEKFKDNSQRN